MRKTRSRALPTAIGAVACGMTLAAGVVAAPPRSAQTTDAGMVADGDALLASRNLAIPVEGVTLAALRDTFSDDRGGHRHEAIDIAVPRGTKVFAVDDGRLVKLFTSVAGGRTVYQFDPQGRLVYQYAHVDRYADGLREGMTLHRCELLGYVGTSGNAPPGSPHLHFAVLRLGPGRQWWKGTPLNPYPALTGAALKASTLKESASGGPTGSPLAHAPPSRAATFAADKVGRPGSRHLMRGVASSPSARASPTSALQNSASLAKCREWVECTHGVRFGVTLPRARA